MSTLTEDAYVAGLLDADGSIGLYRNGNSTYVQGMVNIASQDFVLVEWLCQEYNGRFQVAARCYIWKPRNYLAFLPLVVPYLRVKRAQAELLLEYRSVSGYGKPSPSEKDKFVLRSKELNAKLPMLFSTRPSTDSKSGE